MVGCPLIGKWAPPLANAIFTLFVRWWSCFLFIVYFVYFCRWFAKTISWSRSCIAFLDSLSKVSTKLKIRWCDLFCDITHFVHFITYFTFQWSSCLCSVVPIPLLSCGHCLARCWTATDRVHVGLIRNIIRLEKSKLRHKQLV